MSVLSRWWDSVENKTVVSIALIVLVALLIFAAIVYGLDLGWLPDLLDRLLGG